MMTKNIDFFKKSNNNRQLIVSRFINEKGDTEEGQAMISSGSFNDYHYQFIHKKNTIKKEAGDSEESFLSEDIFMNKVPFSFENEKVLVLTCLYAFSAYSDGSLIETPSSLGIEDSFFQEKSFKDVKTLDMDLNQYLNDLTPSKFKRESTEEETNDNPPCSSLTYELDIPIFGIKNSKEIQFAEGPISLNFTFSQEPSKNQKRNKCEYLCWPGISEDFIKREDGTIDYSRYVLCERGGDGGGEINCDPPEPYKGPEVNFYGMFEVDFGPNA